MNTELENIYEYEMLLIGNISMFTSSFSKSNSQTENLKEAGNMWRYAITKILGWTPYEATQYLTENIVNMLRLDKTYAPIGITPQKVYLGDYKYILQYAFPDEIKYNLKEQTLDEYKKIASMGKYVNDANEEKTRIPKNFWADENGSKRASIVLNYLIDNYLSDMNTIELYDFFADTLNAKSWLLEKKLKDPLKVLYNDPLDYLHEALPYYKQDSLLYYSLKMSRQCEEIVNAENEENIDS